VSTNYLLTALHLHVILLLQIPALRAVEIPADTQAEPVPHKGIEAERPEQVSAIK